MRDTTEAIEEAYRSFGLEVRREPPLPLRDRIGGMEHRKPVAHAVDPM